MLLRRQIINLSCILNSQCPLRVCSYSSRTKKASQANEFNFVEDNKPRSEAANFGRGVFHQLSPLYRDNSDSLKDCRIELVDNETWNVSSGLAEAWKGNTNVASKKNPSFSKEDEIDDDDGDTDVDDIEDMRIRGNLFYKLDKDSKEYEEYTFDFHRRNKNKNNGNDNPKEKEKSSNISASGVEKTLKGSVSASIIHRATSKVVAVAHSISKDMKFDLASTKNNATCAAVGEVLAQRALADDIHNVVYTPRKGEKLEGKLNIVLQSVINNGVNVKVKLKQRKTKKPGFHRPTA
ncbi:hypothetical protein K7X08_032722 [Anisodus acutangulus]|uniref:Uncharacterized protein n=1 Tax=Anisodus acutangulus TaxID=402998 RepID=A0A9Q1R9H0_9SOLA|nr:hypothetical protein K7X08_032722 [Anisodus acutangulus]